MKGGGVFTQQSVRLSNFQIKIRFAGTCSWKRGNWLRLCSIRISRDIFWLRISFHDLHHSHEKVCLLMTAVYVVRTTSICTATYILNSDLCGQKFSQKDRDLLLCKKDFHHHCRRAA